MKECAALAEGGWSHRYSAPPPTGLRSRGCGLGGGRPGTQAPGLGVLTVGILAEMNVGCQARRKRGLTWGRAETSWRAQIGGRLGPGAFTN